jgi:hypothetical protein
MLRSGGISLLGRSDARVNPAGRYGGQHGGSRCIEGTSPRERGAAKQWACRIFSRMLHTYL